VTPNDRRRHHPVVGHKFSIGAMKDGLLVGVVIVGRAVCMEELA